MRSFSNITLKFANKLHLLVDSLHSKQIKINEQKSNEIFFNITENYYLCSRLAKSVH